MHLGGTCQCECPECVRQVLPISWANGRHSTKQALPSESAFPKRAKPPHITPFGFATSRNLPSFFFSPSYRKSKNKKIQKNLHQLPARPRLRKGERFCCETRRPASTKPAGSPPLDSPPFPSIRNRNDRQNVFVTCSSHAPLAGSAPACFPPQ